MHPAKEGFSALPFFDEFDLSTVDILLISQYVYSHSLLLCHTINAVAYWGQLCIPMLAYGPVLDSQSHASGCLYLRNPVLFNAMPFLRLCIIILSFIISLLHFMLLRILLHLDLGPF